MKMTHMIGRILQNRLRKVPKSVLLLGPRQVGKSTLCTSMNPDLTINLADEETFRHHLTDPGLLKRIVQGMDRDANIVLVDEIQRIPTLLNTIQSLVDANRALRFLLTGSSARKLKRGNANLLPGRVLIEHLPPLLYWELGEAFNLQKALTIGTLPEVYLETWGPELLDSYVAGYLKEEIQGEALTRDLASYSRFLNLAAEMSGQYINYAKISSDAEVAKETIRRYMEILTDTLIVERISSYRSVDESRRARQKEKFIFFDLGVRNALLGRTQSTFSKEERGLLFEQWLTLQVLYDNRLHHRGRQISTYRDAMGVEVDLIIESDRRALAVEIKTAEKVHARMFKGLLKFCEIAKRPFERILVYTGEHRQRFEGLGDAVPYTEFLDDILMDLQSPDARHRRQPKSSS